MSAPLGYSRSQIWLHWMAAILIVGQFLGEDAISGAWRVIEKGGTPAFDPLVLGHVAGGFAIVALAAWRIAIRARRGAPKPPADEPPLLQLAARVAHAALYALMVALPLTGAAAWFGGIGALAELHEGLTGLLMLLVALHVGAALFHQFWLRNGLLDRMKTPRP